MKIIYQLFIIDFVSCISEICYQLLNTVNRILQCSLTIIAKCLSKDDTPLGLQFGVYQIDQTSYRQSTL